MLKKMQPERICEECGRLIRNRRADARKCIDCRREISKSLLEELKQRERRKDLE